MEWEAAAQHYQAHLLQRPKDFDIWVQCGHVNKEAGRYVEALKCYSMAQAIRPKNSDNLLSLGHLYKKMNLPLMAEKFYKLSFDVDGNVHAANELENLSNTRSMIDQPVGPAQEGQAFESLSERMAHQTHGLTLEFTNDVQFDPHSGELVFTSGDPWLVFKPISATSIVGILLIESNPPTPEMLDGQIFFDYGAGYKESESIAFLSSDILVCVGVVGLEHVRSIRWDPTRAPGRLKLPKISFLLVPSADDPVLDQALRHLPPVRATEVRRLIKGLLIRPVLGPEEACNLTLGMRLTLTPYERWIAHHATLQAEDYPLIKNMHEGFKTRPLFSFVVPTFNTPNRLLRECLDSLRAQTYENFEICIADDNSSDIEVWNTLVEYDQKDPRIKIMRRSENGMISIASNSALGLANGDFIILVDHDDVIPEFALSVIAWYINVNPEARIFYSDEDKINFAGERCNPYFKSDFNLFLMYGHNMVTHLSVYDRRLVENVGGFRRGLDGSQDYDLFFRCMEVCGEDQIVHIPHVLYHWRMIAGSTAVSADQKSYAFVAAKDAINGHFDRMAMPFRSVDGWAPGVSAITPTREFDLPISIIIPTRNGMDVIEPCISSIICRPHNNVEIIIIDNASDDPRTLEYLAKLAREDQARVIRYDGPFNFSAINNFASKFAKGDIICFLNDDTEVIRGDWLNYARALLSIQDVGIVGARLLYPDGSLQHFGVITGAGPHRVAIHAHWGLDGGAEGYFSKAQLIQQSAAVTAACMFIGKATFDAVGGFEEDLALAYNDVDLCLKVRKAGYRVIVCPEILLVHAESRTRGADTDGERAARLDLEAKWMRERWGEFLADDPFYSPNLSLDGNDYAIADPPRVTFPWRN